MRVMMSWRGSSIAVVAVAVSVLAAWQAFAPTREITVGSCLETCKNTGCAEQVCLPSCQFLNSSHEIDGVLESVLESVPLYHKWQEWVCSAECRYRCMLSKETQAAGFEQDAIGYRDNWCLIRVIKHQQNSKELYSHLAIASLTQGIDLGLINKPLSVAFSVANLLVNLAGLVAFVKLVYYGLPTRPVSGGPFYPFAGLWTTYGVFVTLYWLGQCIFHSREMPFDMHLDSSIEVLLASFTLFLTIVRVGEMRSEQARVIVMAPLIGFLLPHLCYVNICTFDYGLSVLVLLALGTVQYILWITWAGITRHPAKPYLWLLLLFAVITLFLRFYDLSYVLTWLDIDAPWILSAIPSSVVWWLFARSDALYRSNLALKKSALHKDA